MGNRAGGDTARIFKDDPGLIPQDHPIIWEGAWKLIHAPYVFFSYPSEGNERDLRSAGVDGAGLCLFALVPILDDIASATSSVRSDEYLFMLFLFYIILCKYSLSPFVWVLLPFTAASASKAAEPSEPALNTFLARLVFPVETL